MTDPRVEFFDRCAPTWDTEGPPHEQILARLQRMASQLGIRAGQNVLEVGCGTGSVTPWLAETVAPGRVTAVDFSPAMLAAAQARGVDADFACVDVCSDELGTRKYDVVLCLHVLPHLRDVEGALERFRQALKPAGLLLIMHFDNWQKINAFHDEIGPPVAGDHLPEPGELKELLRQHTFQVLDLRDERDLFCVRARLSREMPD